MKIQMITDFFGQFGIYGILISIIVNILIAVSGILPSILVTSANIILYGPVIGFVVSWVGETLGVTIAFYVYRVGFKQKVENFREKYNLIKKITEAKGINAGLLVLQGRFLPFLPSGFVTGAAAVSEMSLINFSVCSGIGKIPALLIEVMASYDLLNINSNYLRFSITIIIILLIYLYKAFYIDKK